MTNNNIKFENFIFEYDNFFSEDECKQYIDTFDGHENAGFTLTRKQSYNTKATDIKDSQLFATDLIEIDQKNYFKENSVRFKTGSVPLRYFVEKFLNLAYPQYLMKHDILQVAAKHGIRNIKIQKTQVGEGFHQWHFENTSIENSVRIMTFIVYLNDVDDGGETEFLYYPLRIKPKVGKLILWPAGYTHTHRGNPPLTNTKYVITGWVELVE
jgi:hypothetical protein